MFKLISSIIAAASVAAGATYYTTSAYYQKTTVVEVPDIFAEESTSRIMQKLDRYLDRQIARLDEDAAEKAEYRKFMGGAVNVKPAPWTKR